MKTLRPPENSEGFFLSLGMNKILLLIIITCSSYNLQAQLIFDYTNCWHFMGTYNPAAISYQQEAGVTAVARKQWIGFEGSPFGTEFISDVRVDKINSSFGLVGAFHSAGFLRDFALRGQYAYRFEFTDETYLQAGLDLGFNNTSINNAIWIANANDPNIPASYSNDFGFTLGGGLFFNHPHFLLSLSTLQANEPYLNEININLTRHYSLITAYKMNFGEAGELMPLINVLSDGTSTSIAANLIATYDHRLSGGIGIRINNAILFTGSYSTKSILLGYSFDLTTTTIAQYSR